MGHGAGMRVRPPLLCITGSGAEKELCFYAKRMQLAQLHYLRLLHNYS